MRSGLPRGCADGRDLRARRHEPARRCRPSIPPAEAPGGAARRGVLLGTVAVSVLHKGVLSRFGKKTYKDARCSWNRGPGACNAWFSEEEERT